jgi:excisionase family DNA binding protein
MTDQAGTFQQATVPETARILGVSVQTVRRMIRRGQIEGRRVYRPQGSAFIVTLPVDGPRTNDVPATDQAPRTGARANGPGPTTAPELMAAWSETFLGPIMARMAEQETTIRELERENGRLTAELAAARAAERPQEARETPSPVETPTEPPAPGEPGSAPWWRRWLAAYG